MVSGERSVRKLRNCSKLQDRSAERQGACLVTAPFRRHSVEFSCCINAGIETHPAMELHRVLKPRAPT
jgi:hypothetical protein